MEHDFLISICIPSYNRPKELLALLNSVDSKDFAAYEVVICEDFSPKRDEINLTVLNWAKSSPINLNFVLNDRNYGYDANLRQCVSHAKGKYILFMGDDDTFEINGLNLIKNFLVSHPELGYVMKSHIAIHKSGEREIFRYFDGDKYFKPGKEAVFALFRKSVFISGFCIDRKMCLPHFTTELDGTLLFQLYLLTEVCLISPSAYFDKPIVVQTEELRQPPLFGSSSSETTNYTPGTITVQNSINFMKSYLKVSRYIDSKHPIGFTNFLIEDISKYSYPVLNLQRDKGIKVFKDYNKELRKEIQINRTWYYYIYYYSLLIFGKSFCDKTILFLKRVLGRTPSL